MSKPKATCGLISLGCAKNLVDSEVMLGTLQRGGYALTGNQAEADVLIVNTCGFISPAVAESTAAIREAVERKRRGECRAVIATGCLVQRDAEGLQRDVSGVDAFLGLNEFPQIADVLDQLLSKSKHATDTLAHPLARVNPEVWYVYDETTPRVRATPPWYAYLKISEGCDHRCTFCIIPKLRGDMRSRPLESIVKEAQRLSEEGVRELVLIAQDSTRYGMDLYGQPQLAELLRRLAAIDTLRWIRVLYAYPLFINDELIEVMASRSNLCKYIDVPLQHAHADMLKAMQRAGSPDSYRRMIERLRHAMPDVTIRTTFIVGFPGETDQHFSELSRFVDEVEFDRVAVFKYTPEREAPSSAWTNQISETVKDERYHALMATQQRASLRRNRRWLNREVDVLLEQSSTKKTSAWLGRREGDAPEIDAQVRVHGLPRSTQPGTFARVRIQKTHEYDLEGWALR